MKAITQGSNIVRMSSLGKSHENRDQFLLQVRPVKQVWLWLEHKFNNIQQDIFNGENIYVCIVLKLIRLITLQIQANQQVIKPLVFISCGIHAREWIAPASCMYIIHQVFIPNRWRGGGKRRVLGPRYDVLTTCKAVNPRASQRPSKAAVCFLMISTLVLSFE